MILHFLKSIVDDKRINKSSKASLLGAIALFSITIPQVQAQDTPDWWFDVELLVVKHEQSTSNSAEVFPQTQINDLRYSAALFEEYLLPDIRLIEQHLPQCEVFEALETLCKPVPTFIDFLDEWLDMSLMKSRTGLNVFQKLPVNYDGYIPPRSEEPHFLPKSSLTLHTLYADLRWDNTMTPLLHVAWRQPVAEGEENASFYRIKAGENLNYQELDTAQSTFHLFTELANLDTSTPQILDDRIVTDSLVSQIEQNLASPERVTYSEQVATMQTFNTSTEPVFELDGGIKIFIKYYSGVPYLHVVGDLVFANKDKSTGNIDFHAFQQRRRIISKQVHYFDHPYFGLVITLTRHKRPAATGD